MLFYLTTHKCHWVRLASVPLFLKPRALHPSPHPPGNGVVPQQATAALHLLITRAIAPHHAA
ncbi:hypothetical protein [Wenjunlia tyrosinilytica]|uniref:Uncharacterized protein n=1 Tax=Wenjunlia tyrosinilytica TaxID=1544741 RepID=A0A917ZZ38_9ACTN|nr:hypothetical protein [Wenjunlia tyrosinilytica]GGP01201.1 hypothetical protein GCM10012280_71580 [Wenjunlia tyrosinilytica]